VILALAAWLAAAGSAQAHDSLTGSNPGDGAELQRPPATVSLVFSASPLTVGAFVSAVGPDGAPISLGEPQFDGPTVSATWPASAGSAGVYQVVWRVVSSDGHPIEGTVSFSLLASSSVEPTASPSASEGDGGQATTTGSTRSWLVPALGVAVVAAVLGLVLLLSRRRAAAPQAMADDDVEL
jgi:copper resistance protein C